MHILYVFVLKCVFQCHVYSKVCSVVEVVILE